MKIVKRKNIYEEDITDYEFGGVGDVSFTQKGKRFDFEYSVSSCVKPINYIERFIKQLQKAVNKAKQVKDTQNER